MILFIDLSFYSSLVLLFPNEFLSVLYHPRLKDRDCYFSYKDVLCLFFSFRFLFLVFSIVFSFYFFRLFFPSLFNLLSYFLVRYLVPSQLVPLKRPLSDGLEHMREIKENFITMHRHLMLDYWFELHKFKVLDQVALADHVMLFRIDAHLIDEVGIR